MRSLEKSRKRAGMVLEGDGIQRDMRTACICLLALTACPEKRINQPPDFRQVLKCSLNTPPGWKASPSTMPDHLFEALEWPDGQNPTGRSIGVKDEGERGIDAMAEVLKQRTKESLGAQPNFAVLEESKTAAGTTLWFSWGEPVRNDGYFISTHHGRTVVAWSQSLDPSKRQSVQAAFSTLTCAKK